MSASDTVEALLSLQEIDERIARKEDELDSLVPEIREAEDRLRAMEEDVDRVRSELEAAEKAYRSDQRSVEGARSTLKRLQERAEQVETMKQLFLAHRDLKQQVLKMAEDLSDEELSELNEWLQQFGVQIQRKKCEDPLHDHSKRRESRVY